VAYDNASVNYAELVRIIEATYTYLNYAVSPREIFLKVKIVSK